MAFLSRLKDFFSGRFTAGAAASQIVASLKSEAPQISWNVDRSDPQRPRIAAPGRWTLTLENCRNGAEAHLAEPTEPGRDLPPFLLRAPYDAKSLVYTLAAKALMEPGSVSIYWLRLDAVYEVSTAFTDHYGTAFATGTRLTFRERHYLPYHGGHTLIFREASVYLQDDDEPCRNFGRHFRVAKAQ